MSAIFGLIHLAGQPVDQNELHPMKEALAAHGPDASGMWNEEHIGLGQCLMRFTPEDAFENQPLRNPAAQYTLVCDARIDNRPELIAKLGIPVAEAVGMPDSAFIMMAYEKWGLDCPLHLAGPFAFALWDGREQQLILARSPRGERPLYYHASGQTVSFATFPKGLFALSHINRAINREYVADYLVLAPPDLGSTFYQDINRLPAGSRLIVTSSGTTLSRYWQPDVNKELHLSSDEEYVEAFNTLFDRVVSDHLRCSSNAGVMMSGGYDSTAVAAIAANQMKSCGKRLPSYTEVPRPGFNGVIIKGRYADETPYTQAMAEMYENIDPYYISSGTKFYLDDITSFFTAADIPFRNASNRSWYEAILSEARRNNTRVLLTGASGNLTISWDGKGLLPQLVRKGQLLRAWDETASGTALSRLRRLLGSGCLPLLPNFLWKKIQAVRHPAKIFLNQELPWGHYSPIHPTFAKQQRLIERARDKGWDFQFRVRDNTRIARIATLQMLDSYNASNYTGAYMMNFGIDLRDPTGDLRLVEFCLALPEEQFLRNGKSRWLLQRAMTDRLPPIVLNNRQRGLQAAGWFESLQAVQPLVRSELAYLRQSPLASEILDIHRIQELLDKMDSTPCNHSNARRIMYDYRQIMETGLMTGRFLRWVEGIKTE